MVVDVNKAKKLLRKSSLNKEDLSYLKEFFLECNDKYYNTEEPLISDTIYDSLYQRYIDLGGEELVGSEPEDKTVSEEHKYPHLVGTTLKAPDNEVFVEWLEGVYKTLGLKKTDYLALCVTLKFDGNSICIEYDKNGNVKRALTRGRNGKGKDVTTAVENIAKINNTFNEEIGIKYEALITYTNLEYLREATGKDYKNPRNTVSGLLNGNEPEIYEEFYTLEPLWIEKLHGKITRYEELSFITNEFPHSNIVRTKEVFKGTFDSLLNQIFEYKEEVLDSRENLDFMIDGIVIDVMDKKYRKKLGEITGGENIKPKWCIALKFPYLEAETTVEDIDFSLGNNGKITPVCYFKPIKFNGATHIKQSLQNLKRFNELGLAIGSKIVVELHNDTLSYIKRVDPADKEREKKKAIKFTDVCPVCGEPIKIVSNKEEETLAYCVNEYCTGRITGKINNYISKMDLKGIEINTVEAMFNAGIWKSIIDIYTFDPKKAYSIDGLGKTSVDKIVKTIDKKKPYDYEVLGSLGIKSFALDTAKKVVLTFPLEKILLKAERNDLERFTEEITVVENVGEILAENLWNALRKEENKNLIEFLIEEIGIKRLSDETEFDEIRRTFVITGDLYHYNDRDELKEILERRGHKLTGSVSKKTDYLITNDKDSGTVKNKKAEELGIPIISEDELIEMLNLQTTI